MRAKLNPAVYSGKRRQDDGAWKDGAPLGLSLLSRQSELSSHERLVLVGLISVVFIAIVALGGAVYFARPVLLPITAAFVMSVLLAPAAEWLRRCKAPPGLRAFLVVGAAFLAFTSALYLVIQPGAAWIENLPNIISQAKEKLVRMQDAVDKVQDVSAQVNQLAELGDASSQEVVVVEGPGLGDSLVASARMIVVQIIFATILTYFFLSARDDIRKKLLLLRKRRSGMMQTSRMIKAVEEKVGSYMLTMLIINLGLGCIMTIAMWAIGMPSPFVWGGLATLLNFIPYLGPITLTILLALSGIVHYETVVAMAAPALIYVVLNFLESNIVTPTLIGVRLTISPLAVILNISFWTWIWGPAGAVNSIPVLVIFKTVCDYSDTLRPLGLMIGDAETFRPAKRRNFKR